jgi:acetyltransferase-like isoleucine patch superfamily enzyme
MLSTLWRLAKTRMFVSGRVQLGKRFHLGLWSYVSSPDVLDIGDDVYIGKFCSVQCSGTIGTGVLIANNVGIVGRRDHDIRDIGTVIRRARSVASCPDLAKDLANRIEIGPDVWIGFGATILSGIKIGRGAIVSAGSVVVDDVSPYVIVSGNPAVAVSTRFSDNQIVEHENLLQNRLA